MIRLRVAAGWTNDEGAFRTFVRYAEDETGRWRDLRLTRGDYDVLLLFNAPNHVEYDPSRTIVFESEPQSTRQAEFRYPYRPDEYLAFYDLERHHFVGEWFVDPGQVSSSPKKTRTLSTITSGIGVLPRHRLRKDFVARWLRTLPELEDFGRPSPGFEPRRGPLHHKEEGLLPYRYTFAAENSVEPNYFTEKILDPLLCETLSFYDGCPNLELFVDPGAFVRVDMARPEEALAIMREAIDSDLWSERRDILRAERERLLIQMNPLEIARKLIHGEPTGWRASMSSGVSSCLPPIIPAPLDPRDRVACRALLKQASRRTRPTLVFDLQGRFLEDAQRLIASAAASLPPEGGVLLGGVGMRFSSVSLRKQTLPNPHRLRRMVPGPRLRGTCILITPRAASRLLESHSGWPINLGCLPTVHVVDPPVFYVAGPHMTSLQAERPPVVYLDFRCGWYERLRDAVKRLPRGQRIARGLIDAAWLASEAWRRR